MTELALDTAFELLQLADEQGEAAENNDSTEAQRHKMSREKESLLRRARNRKKNRIIFFKNGDGLELRLKVSNHPFVIGDRDMYCGLCGQNREISFRGHRTNHKCGFNDVHLCVKIYADFGNFCLDIWLTNRKLKPQDPLDNHIVA